jgi:phenylpropionate dioxygenase-like ring-hydroxylating dioxygenase large terminal subunit
VKSSYTQSLRDRDGQLIENWYVVCLSEELAENKAIRRVIYDLPLVIFRDQDGRPTCLPDRCLHRAVKLSEGTCQNGTIRCPYHGWRYAANGKVIEIPSEGQCAVARDMTLKVKKCIEQDGVIWVWMGERQPSTDLPPWRFPKFDDKKWEHYFMITDFENEVTNLAENFMDVPHTIFVHDKWFRRSSQRKVPMQLDVSNGRVLVTYNQPSDSIGWTSRVLNPNNAPMLHTDEFIFPNLTRVDYSFGDRHGFVINSQCTPISTMKTRVYTYICYRNGWLTKLLKPFFRFYTRVVIQQDVEIMKNQGSNLLEHDQAPFRSTDADEIHLAIEHLRSLGVRGDQKLFSFGKQREKEFWI